MKKIQYKGEPVRLDKYLTGLLEDHTRSFLQKQIKEGHITVNGETVRPSYMLADSDLVMVDIPDPVEPEILPREMDLDILYEDNDLLIINKPKGMVVHPAAGHTDDTLVNGLMAYCKEDLSGINGVMRPGIVHRIDKDTSGSLVVCKNDRTHQALAAALKEHDIKRVYVGLVSGYLRDDEGTVTGAVGRSQKDRKKMAVVPEEKGRAAVTHYRVLERFKSCTYVEFTLETGRTHQIRVHMANIHHPLVGDELYGKGKNSLGISGQALHARTLGFTHPATGEWIEVDAPLPDYMKDALKRLKERQ